MNYNRRKFFQYAGAAAAGAILLPHWACKSDGTKADTSTAAADSTATTTATPPSLAMYGCQLYTLRDVLPADPKGVVTQLAGYGYKQVESYEGDKGMFWGMTNTEFKKLMDDLGMTIVSSHCDTKKDFEKKAAQAAEIGMKYLIAPWVGPQKKMDDWKKIAAEFNRLGGICQKAGIRFAYHNHGYSFQAQEGVVPQDFLMENTDPALVDYEMDIYWVVTGGADPIAYLQKYPNRFRLCHVKDRLKNAPAEEQEASCDLGTGGIDFPKILKVAQDNGMQYYIVEQERYDNSTPLKSAEADAAYLSKLVFS
ncbi:MAG: sugar phosphate isomerase/epimerase [Bacteroidetes bacterium]|nr:sugar phosphate isomerase/epimerase [Bacteroidota bacterium]